MAGESDFLQAFAEPISNAQPPATPAEPSAEEPVLDSTAKKKPDLHRRGPIRQRHQRCQGTAAPVMLLLLVLLSHLASETCSRTLGMEPQALAGQSLMMDGRSHGLRTVSSGVQAAGQLMAGLSQISLTRNGIGRHPMRKQIWQNR